MRIALFIIGISGIVGGLYSIISSVISNTGIAHGCCGGTALVLGGVVHLIAAAKDYRGHWSFVIGIALIVIGFFGLGREIDDAMDGRSTDVALGVLLVLMLSTFGTLSLWSGHKLHRCSLELERKNRASST